MKRAFFSIRLFILEKDEKVQKKSEKVQKFSLDKSR